MKMFRWGLPTIIQTFLAAFILCSCGLNPAIPPIPQQEDDLEEKSGGDEYSFALPEVNLDSLLGIVRGIDTCHYDANYRLMKGQLFRSGATHIYVSYDVKTHEMHDVVSHQKVYSVGTSGIEKEIWSFTNEWGNVSPHSDTLGDVNGDGHRDFMNYHYGPNGCCLRHALDVYLFDSAGDTLRPPMSFLNTVFFPDHNRLAALGYGHAPDLFLMKWNGYELDTLEQIVHEENSEMITRIRNRGREVVSTVVDSDPVTYNCLFWLDEYYKDYRTIWPIETSSPERVPEPIAHHGY